MIVGDIRLPLVVLAASVALVLAVMAANVSGLFLAGGQARRRELAVRAALGASRGRLVRQLGWEAMLVTVAGGLAGVVLARLATAPLVAAYPGLLPRASAVVFDGRAALSMVVLTLLAGLAVAAVPAWRLTGRRLAGALGASDRGGGSPARGAQQLLVVTELALSVAVTVGAVLLVQSFARLQAEPLGFDPDGVLVATVSLGGQSPDAESIATTVFAELRDRVRRMPGVVDAGVISAVPLVNRPPPDLFMIDGRPVTAPGEPGPLAHYVTAGPGALEALGARLRRGRLVTTDDEAAEAPVAVVNEAMVRRYWPGEDPVGRRVRYPTGLESGRWTSWTPWITVVGVVGDIRSIAPADAAEPAIYASYAQRPRAAYSGTSMRLVMRLTGATPAPTAVRDLAKSIDPRAVSTPPAALSGFLGSTLAQPRFLGALMSGFAGVALAIALVGIYGLVSYRVASRLREFGVRMALGASRARIFRLVAFQLMTAVGVGVPAGLAGAWVLARWMSALLYGVDAWEPWTYGGVAAGLSLAVLTATAIPARRATRVDPLVALRAE